MIRIEKWMNNFNLWLHWSNNNKNSCDTKWKSVLVSYNFQTIYSIMTLRIKGGTISCSSSVNSSLRNYIKMELINDLNRKMNEQF